MPPLQVREAGKKMCEGRLARQPVFVISQKRQDWYCRLMQRRSEVVELCPVRPGRTTEDQIADNGQKIRRLLGDLSNDLGSFCPVRLAPKL
jgi:hypothetical protein